MRDRTRPRGVLYVAVLCVGLLIAVMGFSGLMVARLQAREGDAVRDSEAAEQLASAALEIGRLAIDRDTGWRSNYTSGSWGSVVQLGGGRFDWRVIDEVDGNLLNSGTDPIRLYGRGTFGSSVRATSVLLTARPTPLPVLGMAIHTAGQLHVRSGQFLRVPGAIASTNGTIRNDGTITGNVEALLSTGTGTVTGTTTLSVAGKSFPDSSVITLYTGRGVVINPGTSISGQLLSPASNPWGSASPEGVYVINSGSSITIADCRILGTLVINCPGQTVTVQNTVLMQPARSDYPVLIINGNALLRYNSPGSYLSESTAGRNFNPAGSPYQGATDTDQTDTYPSEIQGLVHITGTLTTSNTPLVRGLVLVESAALTSAVDISGTFEIAYDAGLYSSPPDGYSPRKMAPQAGSRRREGQ